jgi:UDP-glucose 4-epimerase
MNILVIGSKGFIGSHCVTHFSDKKYQVIGCDVIDVREKNYISLPSINYNYNEIFTSWQFDYCINAAGSAHVDYSFKFPEKDFELNVSLVINLLGAIKNHQPACKFINFSSAAVYGNPSSIPIPETTEPKPLSPYGYHKLLSENLLYEYHRFFNIKTCSLRIFSVYGEGLRKQLFWDIYNKSKNGETIELFGTGNESRDFIYVHDLVKIIELIIQKSKFEGEVYNVANAEEVFIKDAVDIFLKELGWKGNVVYTGKEKIGDPINWKADIRKIRELGYIRNYNFLQGIQNQCAWLKDLK